jgi:hypothetical protein
MPCGYDLSPNSPFLKGLFRRKTFRVPYNLFFAYKTSERSSGDGAVELASQLTIPSPITRNTPNRNRRRSYERFHEHEDDSRVERDLFKACAKTLISSGADHIRPHQGIGNTAPLGLKYPVAENGPVKCESKLGGVIKQFYREAS